MKNEGVIERGIQETISALLFLGAFFWTGGILQVALFVASLVVGAFAVMGFCSFYKFIGKDGICSNEKLSKVKASLMVAYFLIFLAVGFYASIFFTKKIFVEDFNAMNSYYKQALFNTGQEKRTESIENYESLVMSFAIFEEKYLTYKPYSLKFDKQFEGDLRRIEEIIVNSKEEIYNGNLKNIHLEFEKIRLITQDIFKRNGFSMLAITLVDFHDSMEKVLDKANAKDVDGVILTYVEASDKFIAVELEASDDEIKLIRKNLDDLLNLAKNGDTEKMPAKAAELKSSFVKVYLIRG